MGEPHSDVPSGRVLGVILAGGQSRRMGVDKGLLRLHGKPLISHAIDRLTPQVSRLILNANGDPARYTCLGLPVVADTLAGQPGPLAGLLAAMRWAEQRAPDITHIATAPVDTPFFPLDFVARSSAALVCPPDIHLAYAATAEGPQPVFALVDVGLADALERDLIAGSARRVMDWLRGRPHVEVLFEKSDAFFNINGPEDLAKAEEMAATEVTPPCR